MLFLILTILLNTLIFILFRQFPQYKVNTFQAIVINYLVCSAIGIYFLEDVNHLVMISFKQIWVQTGLILGVLFIFTFYLLGYTTQACGVSTTTVANKMSLIIPVFFSLYVFFDLEKLLTSTDYIGIIIAVLAVLLTSIKTSKQKTKIKLPAFFSVLLPVLVFIFGGAIDTLINYSKFHILSVDGEKVFTTLIFVVAASVGGLILLFKVFFSKEVFEFKSLLAGILLGTPNFFSIYYLIKTLTYFNNNGALVYPLCNMGIILSSGIIGVFIFKEKLSTINKLGMGMALVSLILIAHKELLTLVTS